MPVDFKCIILADIDVVLHGRANGLLLGDESQCLGRHSDLSMCTIIAIHRQPQPVVVRNICGGRRVFFDHSTTASSLRTKKSIYKAAISAKNFKN